MDHQNLRPTKDTGDSPNDLDNDMDGDSSSPSDDSDCASESDEELNEDESDEEPERNDDMKSDAKVYEAFRGERTVYMKPSLLGITETTFLWEPDGLLPATREAWECTGPVPIVIALDSSRYLRAPVPKVWIQDGYVGPKFRFQLTQLLEGFLKKTWPTLPRDLRHDGSSPQPSPSLDASTVLSSPMSTVAATPQARGTPLAGEAEPTPASPAQTPSTDARWGVDNAVNAPLSSPLSTAVAPSVADVPTVVQEIAHGGQMCGVPAQLSSASLEASTSPRVAAQLAADVFDSLANVASEVDLVLARESTAMPSEDSDDYVKLSSGASNSDSGDPCVQSEIKPQFLHEDWIGDFDFDEDNDDMDRLFSRAHASDATAAATPAPVCTAPPAVVMPVSPNTVPPFPVDAQPRLPRLTVIIPTQDPIVAQSGATPMANTATASGESHSPSADDASVPPLSSATSNSATSDVRTDSSSSFDGDSDIARVPVAATPTAQADTAATQVVSKTPLQRLFTGFIDTFFRGRAAPATPPTETTPPAVTSPEPLSANYPPAVERLAEPTRPAAAPPVRATPTIEVPAGEAPYVPLHPSEYVTDPWWTTDAAPQKISQQPTSPSTQQQLGAASQGAHYQQPRAAYPSQTSPFFNPLAELLKLGIPMSRAKAALQLAHGSVDDATMLMVTDPHLVDAVALSYDADADEYYDEMAIRLACEESARTAPVEAAARIARDAEAGQRTPSVKVDMSNGLFEMLASFLDARAGTLNEHCIICDRRQPDATPMLKPACCSGMLCTFQFQNMKFPEARKQVKENLLAGPTVGTVCNTNPWVVDLLVAMAKAAAGDKRRELVMDPFPTVAVDESLMLLGPEKKDFEMLNEMLESFPDMSQLALARSDNDLREKLGARHPLNISLLQWIVDSNRSHLVHLAPENRLPSIKTPFQYVLLSSTQEKEARFQELKKKYGTKFAYHGSPTANWHSILRHGLKNASGTKLQLHGAVHGNGIYLSPVAQVALRFSSPEAARGEREPTAETPKAVREQFLHPNKFVCMALCEIINNDIRCHSDIWVVENEDYVCTRFLFAWSDVKFVHVDTRNSEEASFCSELRNAVTRSVEAARRT